jgi:hypothetical protein
VGAAGAESELPSGRIVQEILDTLPVPGRNLTGKRSGSQEIG